MTGAVLTSTGLFTPPHVITNDELVAAYNAWAEQWNAEHAEAIADGAVAPKTPSSAAFIEKASGIKARYAMDKEGVLDIARMAPRLEARGDDQISLLAEMAVWAAKDALKAADRTAQDVDAVIVAASNMQRAYPAMAIEVQQALGVEGFAFDMNVACSSATFGLTAAIDMVQAGHARAILVCNPEVCTGHLNFRDRDSHFIFGDVATAVLVEREETAGPGGWTVIGSRLKTQFSNNIRNNFGFLNRAETEDGDGPSAMTTPDTDKLFVQQGRKVFKEVTPLVAGMILEHMGDLGLTPDDVKRLWLHQANLNMNQLIAKKVMGREVADAEAPTILDEYANTSSAGSIIAFHKHSADFASGEVGLICSFGAGYSSGSVFVRKR
ncbi:MAG: beta-ketoacyl-ACP synthase III [Maricaulaceae bacterium]